MSKSSHHNIICPDCGSELIDLLSPCTTCSYIPLLENNIYDYLSSDDRTSSFLKKYIELYETIATSEIEEPINSDIYVKALASHTANIIHDISNYHVCDIGSGKGFLLSYLQSKNPLSLTAIDISSSYLKALDDHQLLKIKANAENIPFKNTFDLIFCTDILEHVFNTSNFLDSARKALKSTGQFIVRVPYRENLMQYSQHRSAAYPFSHLRTYNTSLLKDTLIDAGFKPEKVIFDGFQPMYKRSFWKSKFGSQLFNLATLEYSDYWSYTQINSFLGRLLMKPVEVNVLCSLLE